MRNYHVDGTPAPAGFVFVFGSNLSGFHAGGAARAAKQHYGAVEGVGEGITGNSYALPTVDFNISGPLTLDEVRLSVDRFLKYAKFYENQKFWVTRVGCGLAGHKDADIAPMFADAPENCNLPIEWKQYLGD